jgi:hypothetical protein
MKYLLFLVVVCFSLSLDAKIIPLDSNFVNIIGQIESNNNDNAVGDKGKSISRYQIQRAAFIDAKQFDKSIKFKYESLTNQANALKVMTAYLNRYAQQAILRRDYQTLARIWTGGPKGNKKQVTLKYWRKYEISRSNL